MSMLKVAYEHGAQLALHAFAKEALLDEIGDAASSAWNDASNYASDAWTGMGNALGPAGQNVSQAVNNFFSGSTPSGPRGPATGYLGSIGGALSNAASGAWDGLSTAGRHIAGTAREIPGVLSGAASGAWNGLSTAGRHIAGTAREVPGVLSDAASKAWHSMPAEHVRQFGNSMVDTAADYMGSAGDYVGLSPRLRGGVAREDTTPALNALMARSMNRDAAQLAPTSFNWGNLVGGNPQWKNALIANPQRENLLNLRNGVGAGNPEAMANPLAQSYQAQATRAMAPDFIRNQLPSVPGPFPGNSGP